MLAKYLKDVYIPDLDEWSSNQMADPMHPIHGPLPDHAGLLAYGQDHFLVMLWETGQNIQIFLEWSIEDDPDETVPMLAMNEACRHQGKLGRSYCWIAEPGAMTCENHNVAIPQQLGDEDQWRRQIYRKLMKESVLMAATTLIGL